MKKVINVLVLVAVTAAFSLTIVGCQAHGEHPGSEHPAADHEHPKSEHPQ